MVYFCTDLDNTLIFSYRHEIGKQKVLVETLNGKELSFMTCRAYQLLERIARDKTVVPVTTRSLAQFQRIDFGDKIKMRYALAANGGILLEHGRPNQDWYQQTREIVRTVDSELEKGMDLLKSDPYIIFEIRKVDEIFIFTKSCEPEKTVGLLKSTLDQDKVYIDSNGQKIYIFPKALDKGTALRRFRQFVGGKPVFIAAGDSEFDIPMIENADLGLYPEGLNVRSGPGRIAFQADVFAEEMLQAAADYPNY